MTNCENKYIVKSAIAGVEYQFLNNLFNKMQEELMKKLRETGVDIRKGGFFITIEYRNRDRTNKSVNDNSLSTRKWE